MSIPVKKGNHPIGKDARKLISKRYKSITKAVNQDFWDSESETDHSLYVGSYGRGTAINTSDLDVLVELPDFEFEHLNSLQGNVQSRLLQDVKDAILDTYPRTEVKGDGQVVVVNFSDDMRFEIVPAFIQIGWLGYPVYKYPDTHMGGRWLSTNPFAEQEAMREKNEVSGGLLYDTCKHIRYIRGKYYSSYHLSGILIDTFMYSAIGEWAYVDGNEDNVSGISYEEHLLNEYSQMTLNGIIKPDLYAPGSNTKVDSTKDWGVLGKVLDKMTYGDE